MEAVHHSKKTAKNESTDNIIESTVSWQPAVSGGAPFKAQTLKQELDTLVLLLFLFKVVVDLV